MLDGLAAYVRALSPAACPKARTEPIHASGYVADARRAVRAGRLALAHADKATAALMIGSARSQLGLIYERYDTPLLEGDRTALKGADRALAEAADAVRAGDPKADALLAAWLTGSKGWAAQVERDQDRSLFNPRRLAGL